MSPSADELEDSDVAHRRERGRLAQRAFRQRQIDTIRELRDENRALRDAILNISHAATGRAQVLLDEPSLQGAIQTACFTAGLETPEELRDAPMQADTILASSEPLRPESLQAGFSANTAASFPGGQPYYPQQQLGLDFTFPGPNNITTTSFTCQAHAHPNVVLPSQPDPIAHQQQEACLRLANSTPTATQGRMSPRLTYGLWFEPERMFRVLRPPLDIVPFLGDGMYTFAGAVFWSGMGYALSALRTILHGPSTPSPSSSSRSRVHSPASSLGQDSNTLDVDDTDDTPTPKAPSGTNPIDFEIQQSMQIVHKLFGPTLRLTTERTLHDLIHARVMWRARGSINGEHPGRDPDAAARLFAGIVSDAEHAAAVGDHALWMTPTEVETFLQTRLQATPGGWQPWAEALREQVGGDELRAQLIGKLVRMFAQNSTCFAGPRWRVDMVQLWIDRWMHEVSNTLPGFGVGPAQHVPPPTVSEPPYDPSLYGQGMGGFGV
ncbi:hypothetical protein B0H63DRAFT_220125 [Podospora didyma]|uniref:BZIP domain-containing protein n=1 Tax=Podospora didyma TaxID=330526 RepID=A0AAE0KIS4_9PEZI|nr:hypothetical protein B0H63DRAFT_220125 [Podospora didyma]